MAASKDDISCWFDEGVKKGATHLIVACDTFDHDDFPVYVLPGENVRKIAKRYNDSSEMLRLMEVYNLKLDKEEQLSAYRVFNY